MVSKFLHLLEKTVEGACHDDTLPNPPGLTVETVGFLHEWIEEDDLRETLQSRLENDDDHVGLDEFVVRYRIVLL